ncbi:MAG TPA: hypothetical protein VKA19_08100 [Alphaproteobacteria bacterium]|nr:hypothetical protein [Alphaproteobacteria bacterium]
MRNEMAVWLKYLPDDPDRCGIADAEEALTNFDAMIIAGRSRRKESEQVADPARQRSMVLV